MTILSIQKKWRTILEDREVSMEDEPEVTQLSQTTGDNLTLIHFSTSINPTDRITKSQPDTSNQILSTTLP